MPTKNLEKRRASSRRHYERNAEAMKERSRNFRATRKKAWMEYKRTLKCVKCGENHLAALDFHHVVKDPSNRPINQLLKNSAYGKLEEELKKCIVLCANCHRKHHYEEHLERKRRKKGLKKVLIRTNIPTHQLTEGQPHVGKTEEHVPGQGHAQGRNEGSAGREVGTPEPEAVRQG